MTVLPGGEVGPTPPFAAGSVAVGAVRLKQRGTLLQTFGCVKWIPLLLRPTQGHRHKQPTTHSHQRTHRTWRFPPVTAFCWKYTLIGRRFARAAHLQPRRSSTILSNHEIASVTSTHRRHSRLGTK